MLIKLSKNNTTTTAPPNGEQILAITNLLTAHEEQHHHIELDRKTLQIVIDDKNNFSEATRNTALKLKTSSYEKIPSNLLEVHAEIDLHNKHTNGTREENGVLIIELGYGNFLKTANLQPTKFICENIADTKIYHNIGEYYVKTQLHNRPKLNVTPVHGGGSSTHVVFKHTRDDGNIFCFCFVDTDKKHPDDKEGTTSRKFSSEALNYNRKSIAYKIQAHEIESLIPTSIIESSSTEQTHITTIDQIKKLERLSPDAKLFFDHKNGMRLAKAIELDRLFTCHRKTNFWTVPLRAIEEFVSYECLINLRCEPPCCARKIDGLGDRLVERCLDTIQTLTHHKIGEALKSNTRLQEEWARLGKIYTSWALAPAKQRIS